MRRWTILASLLLLSGCGDEKPPVNRIILPAPIAAPADTAKDALDPFHHVYINGEAHVALFFVGDASGMSAHFIDSTGLADQTRLLSAEQLGKLGADDPARTASDQANGVLTETGLPDREFQVLPVEGGYLLQYSYGKLHYLSFLTANGGKLKMGLRADMTLLAKLADAAGAGSALHSLPALALAGGKPGRYVYFSDAPKALGDAILGNASALYRDVTSAESQWEQSDLTAPTSLSDSSDIAAIRARLGPPPVDPDAGSGDEANAAAYSDSADNMVLDANAAGAM